MAQYNTTSVKINGVNTTINSGVSGETNNTVTPTLSGETQGTTTSGENVSGD